MSSTSRITRTLAAPLFLAAALVIAPAANAQVRQPTGLGNIFGNLQVTEPRGDFKQNTGNGFGLGAGLLLRIDPKAVINWRTELGVVSYGRSSRRIPLAGTGGLVKLDLETTSNIFTLVTGPQLLGPTGTIMPYVTALGGFSVFWTESSVEGTSNENEPFASTTNGACAIPRKPGLPASPPMLIKLGISRVVRLGPNSWLTTLPNVGCTTVGFGT